MTDLLARHGRWLDEGRFDEARSVFTEDATVVVASGEVSGVDRIAALARRSHGGHAGTHHLTTNPLITLDGDRATLTAQQIAVFCPTPGRAASTVGEEYRMEAARTPRGWRLRRVAAEVVWRTDHEKPRGADLGQREARFPSGHPE
ncbi:hypothetical protein ABH917_001445 [Thermobifida halotolerans]